MKTGDLIRQARTNAQLTQEQLARRVAGLSAAELTQAESNKLMLTTEQLKGIAKATGVTQKSLLDAARAERAKTTATAAKKTATTAAKKTATTAAKKTTTTAAKKTTTTAAKKTTTTAAALKLSTAEKKLVELYRGADAERRLIAEAILKGGAGDMFNSLLVSLGLKK